MRAATRERMIGIRTICITAMGGTIMALVISIGFTDKPY
jgi:hypothetical protein